MANLNSKEELRSHLKKMRDSLPFSRREQGSFAACQDLFHRIGNDKFVLSFAAFGSEIDLGDLNNKLMLENRLILPKRIGNRLHLCLVTNKSDLEKSSWGIYEPHARSEIIDVERVEIGLIPGLGFDLRSKHRIGYGKGLYDQLLSSAKVKELWGIGFLEQSVEQLPYTSFDIPMNEMYLF